jgi:hypothetical protein
LSSTLAFNPSSIPVSQRAGAVSLNARRNTGLASMYVRPVWQDMQGPPFEAALGQANHFSCRLSKYLAAAAGSQSKANPNAVENARTMAMRVNMYIFYDAAISVGRGDQSARYVHLRHRPVNSLGMRSHAGLICFLIAASVEARDIPQSVGASAATR